MLVPAQDGCLIKMTEPMVWDLGFRIRRRQVLMCLGVISWALAGCSDSKDEIIGPWVAEQTSIGNLYFYRDGTASISGMLARHRRDALDSFLLAKLDLRIELPYATAAEIV